MIGSVTRQRGRRLDATNCTAGVQVGIPVMLNDFLSSSLDMSLGSFMAFLKTCVHKFVLDNLLNTGSISQFWVEQKTNIKLL